MPELAAILPDIRSVHNVGSMFRTADGAGFGKIYLCGVTPTPLDRFGKVRPDLAKVSLGAENLIPWEHKSSATALVRKLKKEGWKIYALEQSPLSRPLFSAKLPRKAKIALVVGSEVDGVPAGILRLADAIFEIPMLGGKESLNVAVAFGIAAYSLALNAQKI